MKKCSKCNIVKPISEFNKNSKKKDGLQGYCRPCKAEVDREYHSKNKEKVKARRAEPSRVLQRRATKYKISIDELKVLMERSGGLCEICKVREGTCIDHCHLTGSVRGILCRWCNSGLGYFFDNRHSMLEAIEYLDAH